jgi:hypothetical protein
MQMIEGWGFNPPPHWPKPPDSWTPPAGWLPDPAWGPVPPGWQLWVPERRSRQRRGVLPAAFLIAVLALAVVGAVVPRADGPGATDPRAAGAVLLLPLQPALLPAEPAASPTPSRTPRSSSSGSAPTAIRTTGPDKADRGKPAVDKAKAVIKSFDTCPELNRMYANGVGLPDAVDRAGGTPVTGFGRSTSLYRANQRLDRDGDGIACEPKR